MNEIVRDYIDRITVSFTGIFGAKFTNFLEQSEMNLRAFRHEWGEEIRGLTPDQIEHAISTIRRRGDTWPPSIGEFIRIAIDIPTPQQIALGDGGELGRMIRNKLGGTSMFKRWDASTALRMVNEVYVPMSDRFIENHINNMLEDNCDAIGHHTNEANTLQLENTK